MQKSQPDATRPLPETAEVGGEGGSFGESTSCESRRRGGHVPRVTDETARDGSGDVTRMTDVPADGSSADDMVKPPTEP